MNSAHCLLLLTNAFLWMLPVIYGHPEQLPELIEDTNENSSTCYGTLKQFQPSCIYRPGTVIGVQAVKVGAKRTSLSCPENIPDAEGRNETCCTPNSTRDCIQVFDYMKSFIPEKYKYHNLCSGYPECIKSAETVWAQTDCDNSTAEYMKNTNYMFMEFSCIAKSKIRNMCANQRYIGSTVYLQSPEYPDRNISANIEKCSCHVTSPYNIKMYTIDVRLYGQTLTVLGQDSSKVYNECNSTMFNITSTILSGGDVWMILNTSSSDNGAYVWVGFEAMNHSSLTITCKVYGPEDIETDTSSPVTLNVSTVQQKSGPSTGRSTSTEPPNGLEILIIIGIAVGLLVLILFATIVCYIVKRKKQSSAGKRNMSTQMQDDKVSDISGNACGSFEKSRTPAHEKFKASSLYSNKSEPTRYADGHVGNRSNTVLPEINRRTRRISSDPINDFPYQPSRLPPLDNTNTLNEISTTEHRHKHRSKKGKSLYDKHTEHRNGSPPGNVGEVRSSGETYYDKSYKDFGERRYLATDERRHSDTSGRRHSGHYEGKHSESKVRRHSDNNERKISEPKGRRHSDNTESRHSNSKERRHSKERKHRHSSKKSPKTY